MRDERFYMHRYDLPFQRHLWEFALKNTTSIYPIARRDPIFTPIFTAVFGAAGITIGATTITFASIATAIATTALTIGLQMLLAPKPPKPQEAKYPMAQPVPYRLFGVGRTRIAGAFMLWESTGPNLHSVQAIAGHRIQGVNRFWLHDDEVTLQPNGVVIGPRGRYTNQMGIYYRVGLPTETPYAAPVLDLSASGLWTSEHRGDGQASISFWASAVRQKDQMKVFPYGPPQLSVEADLARCWDFRESAQSPTDPETWGWTQNSAVIAAWHLCFNEFGFGLDYTKALLPVLDLWKEEADICDEDVPLAGGGTEKRYQCNGYDTAENGPKSALNAILATCDGHLVARGDGARILTVGKFRESRCTTLSDRDIVGHNLQYDVLFEDECNRLIPKFTYPATDYTTSDTDYFEDVDAQLTAGRVLAEEAEYQWCHQWRQARRLGKRDWLRLRQKVKGSIDVRLSGINSVYSRWVRLETPNRLPRLNGKVIENRRSVLAITRGGFTMDIIQHPDNIDAWNPSIDEGKQPPVPTAPNYAGVDTPVLNLVQARASNGSVFIRVVIIDPEDKSLTPMVRYRVSDIGGGVPGAWVEQSFPDADPDTGFINMNTNTVPADQFLDIQAAFKTAGGAISDWTPTQQIRSTVDNTAPANPEALDWTNPNFSARAANTTASVGRTAYLTFKIGTTAQSFAAATLINRIAAAPSDVRYVQPTAVAGQTRRLWCQAENQSGLTSSPVYIDVTFP